MAYATIQSLSRNPLSSPDISGFDAGVFTGAAAGIIAADGFTGQMSGSLGAGELTALAVYTLVWKTAFRRCD